MRYKTAILTGMTIAMLNLYGCGAIPIKIDIGKALKGNVTKEFIGSDEAKQVAREMGAALGRELSANDSEILPEIGKGAVSELRNPPQKKVFDDYATVDNIRTIAYESIKRNDLYSAKNCFKKINDLQALEELSLMMLDNNDVISALNVYEYLKSEYWNIKPLYLTAKDIDNKGYYKIGNDDFKKINVKNYNEMYSKKRYSIIDQFSNLIDNLEITNKKITKNSPYKQLERLVQNSRASQEDMYKELDKSKIIIISDAPFVKEQRDKQIEILEKIKKPNLVVCLDDIVFDAEKNDTAREFGYARLFDYIQKNDIKTISNEKQGNDFYKADETLAKKIANLIDNKKTVVVITNMESASKNHLHYIIEKKIGIDPVLIEQGIFNFELKYFDPEEMSSYEIMKSFGIVIDVLKIGNDFFINTEIKADDIKRYL